MCLDLTDSRVWDHTAAKTVDKIVGRLEGKGKKVRVLGQEQPARSRPA
ncbi:hypothetical protein ACFPPD_13970 [Cohnella suwonensis]|uniref:STAS domain-containing protein n=1 Tax=Cohnella suwonensis TaxID=696072 RepID=A0ABW0LYM3_9BACL